MTKWIRKAEQTANSLLQQLEIILHEGYERDAEAERLAILMYTDIVRNMSEELKKIAKKYPDFLFSHMAKNLSKKPQL